MYLLKVFCVFNVPILSRTIFSVRARFYRAPVAVRIRDAKLRFNILMEHS
jgi:hypothetical protein